MQLEAWHAVLSSLPEIDCALSTPKLLRNLGTASGVFAGALLLRALLKPSPTSAGVKYKGKVPIVGVLLPVMINCTMLYQLLSDFAHDALEPHLTHAYIMSQAEWKASRIKMLSPLVLPALFKFGQGIFETYTKSAPLFRDVCDLLQPALLGTQISTVVTIVRPVETRFVEACGVGAPECAELQATLLCAHRVAIVLCNVLMVVSLLKFASNGPLANMARAGDARAKSD